MTAVDEIESWMVGRVADMLGIAASEVSITMPFTDAGLDSTAAVGMTGELEEWLGAEIDPTACYDYPTIESLAAYVGGLPRTPS